jgi:hypothetical protein
MWSLVITTISDKQQRKSKGLSETQIDDQKKTTIKKDKNIGLVGFEGRVLYVLLALFAFC